MTDELIWLARIAYAVALGFAIGFERKLRFKEAGIRTHTIVCAGSALIMVVSKYAFQTSRNTMRPASPRRSCRASVFWAPA